MRITTVLFDLDGTLLPMDQDEFTRSYFRLLAAKAAPAGYEPGPLVDAIWAGTGAMVQNDGKHSNETAFWTRFAAVYGEKALADKPLFDDFYKNEFQGARGSCGFTPQAAELIEKLRRLGLTAVLATNPIFPAAATESRIHWAGLRPEDFALYTTYENSHFCKPNPEYYLEILRRIDARPEDCLMVGNDVTEDMAAQALGMQVFLLTDCLINRDGKDISVYPHGSFDALSAHISRLAE